MEIKKPTKQYDVVIVGSGAGGGMTAKQLADAGLSVAVVEAGPFFDPKDPLTQTQMKWPWESPRRGASTTSRSFGDFDMCYGGWSLDGEPFTQAEGSDFWWYRARMLGGRTNHWGRISLRFGPKDFKRKSIDGLGDDWPIGYEDVKPYYDKVDKLIGIFGTKEGIENEPDGFFLPPPKPRLHDYYFMKGAAKAKVPVIPARLSILTKRINIDRGLCFFCSQCSRSCNVYADFSAGSCLIFPAQKSGGQIDLFTDCMARKVETDGEGLATAVSYINKKDRQEYQIRGRAIVLAASAASSARILLNSASKQHPNGLGNSSDHVGRYLHDSTGASRSFFVPELLNRKMYNEDGVGGLHVYSPWWLDTKNLDFARGYHLEQWGGLGMPGYGFGGAHEKIQKFVGEQVGGYGSKIKEQARKFYGATIGISGRGESVAQFNNRCTIDEEVVDQFGIPVLKFDYKWTENEIKQAKHMQETFAEIGAGMGAIPLSDMPGKEDNYGITAPGQIIHEVGTTRMGKDTKTSVTNSMGQIHDCKNVFITDGGTFVSQADKNPTWTILALAWRTSDYIIEEFKKKSI